MVTQVSPPASVAIRSLTFGWQKQAAPCLQIDQFDIADGERIVVYGPSGSGKSSLLGLLGGALAPQSGSIKVLGRELSSMTARERDRFRVDRS